MDHAGRIARLQTSLDGQGVDALLVTDLTNVRYLTGFSGTNGQALVMPGAAHFFTDGRYEARSKTLVKAADIAIYPDRLSDVLSPALEAASVNRLGVEGATMTLSQRDDLDERVGAELIATSGVVEELRRSKEPAEVDLIRDAIRIADETFEWVLDRVAPGATERAIALDLEVRMRTEGADEVAFEPIVGSGTLSAHIHHTPSDRAVEKGDLVLMDFGCRVEGYCSDITRTVVLGAASDEQARLYEIVLDAQRAALEAMEVGGAGRDVDAAARKVIAEAGHADHFGHGLGHGVGLDIHEAPRAARTSEHHLGAGDVITNEPGVYVPESGGVRIEDCVLITEDGPEVLTNAPKSTLMEL